MAAQLQDDDAIVDINVTPLVDIMLVLLIIFMVASTYIVNPAIEVELPKAASAGEAVETTLSLVLRRNGEVFLNGKASTEAEIATQCRALSQSNPDVQAIIAADAAAQHGQVVHLIDVIKLSGVTKFAINIDPAQAEG